MEEIKKIKVIVKNSDNNYIFTKLDQLAVENNRFRQAHNTLCDDFDMLVKKHNLLDIAWGISTLALIGMVVYLDYKYDKCQCELESLKEERTESDNE